VIIQLFHHPAIPLSRGPIFAFQALLIFAVLCWGSIAICYEGLEWDRFRLRPEVWIGETYSDNIFLTKYDPKRDFFTHILPQLTADFAIAPRNYLSLAYKGDYQFHSRYDNFRKFQHRGDFLWDMTTSKDSTFKAGAWIKDGAVQPYSEEGFSKDYVEWEAFTDNFLQVEQFTDLGFAYNHTSRRFSDSPHGYYDYSYDDFDRDAVALDLFYDRFRHLPLLLEYRFARQDDGEVAGLFSRDSIINTLFVGARWKPGARLSGFLRLGYTYAAFKEANNFGGFAMDSDLTYRLSGFTTFKLTLVRLVNTSTTAERETGYYYVNTGGTFSTTYTRWDPLTISLDFEYMNRDYDQSSFEADRVDNYYNAGLKAQYTIREWVSTDLSYRYRRTETDYQFAEYTENRVELGVNFSY